MNTFLIELQNRPDGVTNTSITHYSTEATTLAMFYQRCAAAVTSTQFVSVFLAAIDQEGNPIEQRCVVTQYQPDEGGDDGGDDGGDEPSE